ncbi:DNRLRE domain-containing protein [Psychrobacillus sp. FSL K6-4615]|uniref:DNRLRE domain-containing protein n=1 Tax=Psychrobacillus sp. FSL K6-4615 TaxID=2921551 RepID=UPI0030F8486D
MQHKVFTKWLASILAIVLIFTSIPFTNLVVKAEENTEVGIEETPTLPNPDELPTIASGEAPPFEKTDPKEVMELRTESSKVMDNGDGTYSMEMFQEPVFRKNSGKWKEIQPKLKKQKAVNSFASESVDELATENTLIDIRFSPKMNKNKYAVLAYKGHTLSYTFREASGEKGVQKVKNTAASYEENKIFYEDVIPGLTLRNIVFDESVKEDIILSHYSGTSNYHFFMETDLTAQMEENGSITLRDQQNEIIYTLPKPFMTDSNINPESAEPQRSEDVHFELSKEKKGYAFTVVADPNWLKDPTRVYPVYIDPTTKVQANHDASVSSAYPNANYGSDWDAGLGAYILKAGNYSSETGENFAYIQTPTPSLPYATIETAIFNIYNVHSYYPSTLTGIWLDRVNGPWDESTIKWSNKPTSSLFTSTSVHKGKWATFNVKNAVNDWIKGTTPNYGFKLHTNGNGQTFWKKFYSTEHSVADYLPHLNIAYFFPSPTNLSAKSTSLGDGTGYIDLQWSPVAGASSYKVWIFDGNVYKSISVGKNTNWSTKDKSVWPQVGANLPVNPQAVYRASGGTTYNDRTNYAISVSAVFENGESPNANPIVPTIPNLVKPDGPKGVAYSNQIGTNSGYVNLEWDEIPGATGYKVWIFNGLSYEAFDVKNVTNWTTQNKGIWPKPEQIQAGTSSTLKLIQDGSGVELPIDPSPLYAKMGKKYATSNNYWFRISAYNQHGESVFSNATIINLLSQSTNFDKNLGLEDYWDYASHDISNGTNYVNVGTNNNVIQYTDFSLFNYAGFGLDFTRTYNSKDFEKSAFGYGWSFTGSEKLYIGTNGTDIDYKDADGTVHVFTWDGNKYVAPTGNYDRLEKVDATTYNLTTKTGYTTTFTVKENSTDTDVKVAYITKQTDLYNNTITYSYNPLNQLTSITTNLGTKLNFTYNTEGLISKANYNEQEVTYSYTEGNLERVVIKKDEKTTTPTSFNYTTNGQLTEIIDSNQKIMQYEYNSNLDLVSVTEPSLDGQAASITNYSLDRTNNIVTITSPENTVTRYGLNENYSVTEVFDPSGETTTFTLDDTYNILHEVVVYTDGSTYTKDFNYDTKGNVLSTTDSKGVTESYTYDAYSNLLTQTDANNQMTTNTYEKGNLKTTTSPKGEITSYQYDTRGDLKTITYPLGKTDTFDNDYSNNQKRTVHTDSSLGITTETITDFNGNMLSSKDGKGQLTTYQYNFKNELISVTDANGKVTDYDYDGNGNLQTVTNAAGKQMSLEYNAQNAVKKETNALGKATNYHYNADGILTEVVKANGAVIGYSNDEETQTSVVKINNDNQFTSKKDSLITTVTNHTLNNQTVTYTGSENGLLQRIDFSAPKNNAITYNYKNEEALETINFGTNTITYTPDANGQTESLTLNGETIASFKLNTNGLLTSTTLGNGASITNTYIGNETLLKTQTFNKKSTTPWDTHTYDYDANNQIKEVITNAGTVTYAYDAVNQLEQEQYSNGLTIAYTYDDVSNRKSKSITQNGKTTTTEYVYNDANQMTDAGTQSIAVDVNGNVTNDGRYEYVWNAFDQLIEVKTMAGATVVTYKYDENGNRIYSNVDSKETYYRYDGTSNQVLFEANASGEITKSYTYDDNGHRLTMTYSGKTYYYLTNYRGDVLALTDESGTIVAEYTYDAWGNILTQKDLDQKDDVNLAKENPYRYAGYRYDEETKLYYLMARYYNPDTGVFMSLDPVGGDTMNPITMNGYNYANNNPVMFVDPDGEFASDLGARLKYGAQQALKKLLQSWGVPANLGEKIATNGVAFLFGSNAFKKIVNTKINSYSAFQAQVRTFNNTFSKTLIRTAKQNLVKALGKKAVGMMIGGIGGVAIMEITFFAYWTIYYAYNYKPKPKPKK